MKRSELKPRTKPMRKQSRTNSGARKKRDAEQARKEWSAGHSFCWLCAATLTMQLGKELHTHEIVEQSKSLAAWVEHNYARLCSVCHNRVQGRGHNWRCACWALKSLFDPDHYNVTAGMKMLGRKDVEETRQRVEQIAWTLSELLHCVGMKGIACRKS